MKNNYKMPLAVYVLYHYDFTEGENCFNMIYQLLCRDVERPLADGIDIPVYLRTASDDDNIPKIDFLQSDKTAIIMLVDEKMLCSSNWRNYIDKLTKKVSKTRKIFLIELCKYAFEITSETEKIQGIKLNSYLFEENWILIQTRLLENLYRLLIQSDQKVNLFISHAKKDGELEAKRFRDYLRGNSKLDSFFDENDILDGNDFAKQIETNVKNSLLLVFKTDNYSEREWCKKEILIAKNNDIPTVIINNMTHKEKRVFPYMGNCPMLCYNEDCSEAIIALLKVALNQEFQKKFLTKIKQLSKKIDSIIPHYPELYSFLFIGNKKKQQRIIYPEPPIGVDEQRILNKFNSKIKFLTSSEAYIINTKKTLDNKRIAFSVSESDDMQKYGSSKALLKDTVLELSRYLLKAGASLVYGGDLRKDGFTEAFEDFSYQYGKKGNADKKIKYFSNYFAWPIYLNITESQKTDFIHKRVEPIFVNPPNNCKNPKKFLVPNSNENCSIWANSLTKMRKEMEKNVDARIIIGGTLSNFKGKYAGIVEEFIIAAHNKHPVYLIGGFGGAAKALVNITQQDSFDLYNEALKVAGHKDFINYYNSHNPKNKINYKKITSIIKNYKFDNGLTDDENKQLWKSTNVIEIVALVLKGLSYKIGV